MKIKTTLTTDVEMEIEFPYFCKYGNHFTKVISESKSISAANYKGHVEISIKGTSILTGIIAMSEPCTEDEFDAAFNEAYEAFQNLKMEAAL